MTETGGGAVQRRPEESVGTIEVQDGVAAGDVEGERLVELDSLVDHVRRDAGVGHEAGGAYDESLRGGGDGGDWVRVVERVEEEGPRVAADLVRLVAARGARAERVGDGGVAAVRAELDGNPAPGAR